MSEGMKGSRHNATKHGIFAGGLLNDLGSAEAEVFQQLLVGARAAIRPSNGLEEILVEKLAMLFLRLRRVHRADLESAPQLLGLAQATFMTAGITTDIVVRYETGIERQIGRTLTQIQQLRRMSEIDIKPTPQEAQTAETQSSIASEDLALLPEPGTVPVRHDE